MKNSVVRPREVESRPLRHSNFRLDMRGRHLIRGQEDWTFSTAMSHHTVIKETQLTHLGREKRMKTNIKINVGPLSRVLATLVLTASYFSERPSSPAYFHFLEAQCWAEKQHWERAWNAWQDFQAAQVRASK